MAINDILSGVEGVDFDAGLAFTKTAAQIQIPNAKGAYDTYYYLNDGWYNDGTAEGVIKAAWCDGGGNLVDAEITLVLPLGSRVFLAMARPLWRERFLRMPFSRLIARLGLPCVPMPSRVPSFSMRIK